MPRILQIVSGGDINGAIMHAALLTRELARRGNEVSLLSIPHAWIANFVANEGVTCYTSTLRRFPTDELRRVAAIIRQRRIEIIHTHMSRANAFGVLLRYLTGVPVVASAHNRYLQLHWMFNNFVIGTSAATMKFHRRYNFVRKRCSDTIHGFVDLDRFPPRDAAARQAMRASFGVTADEVLIGQVGDVIPRKGLLHLIRAVAQLRRDGAKHIRLAVIGDPKNSADYLASCRREAESLGIADAIHWAGQRRDIPQVLSALDIYALASHEETLPVSVMEAMAAGLPVVSTRVGGTGECVAENETGLLVPPRDHVALAKALRSLVDSPTLRDTFGRAGRRRVEQHFSVAAVTPQVEAVYERLIARRRAAA